MLKTVKQFTKAQVAKIVSDVRRRDGNRCVIHGTPGAQVHEVLQKSSGVVRSVEVFRIKYMACVCQECHDGIHHGGLKEKTNRKILKILSKRFGYKY